MLSIALAMSSNKVFKYFRFRLSLLFFFITINAKPTPVLPSEFQLLRCRPPMFILFVEFSMPHV